MQIIYSGIGCNHSNLHTEKEFLNIMKIHFTESKTLYSYQLQFNNCVLPDDFIFFELSDWIEYSGAIVLQ